MEINGLCDNFSFEYSTVFEWKGQFQLWEVVRLFYFFFSSSICLLSYKNVCWGKSGMTQLISVESESYSSEKEGGGTQPSFKLL